MLGDAQLTAFISTTNPDRARAFYADVLGLRLVEENAFALVFDANGCPLRVTVTSPFSPAPFTVLGWRVSDIASILRRLRAAGTIPLRYAEMEQDDDGIWLTPGGDRVAWFHDPDGNTLSVTEFGG